MALKVGCIIHDGWVGLEISGLLGTIKEYESQ